MFVAGLKWEHREHTAVYLLDRTACLIFSYLGVTEGPDDKLCKNK